MRINILLILIVILYSCGRKGTNQTNETNSIKVIDLLSEPKSEITSLSDIAIDVEYIPLQTTDSSLIDRIKSIKIKGKYIYIKTTYTVYCFDDKGKYLFKLDKSGRGPGEYEHLHDFDINFNNTILAVASGTNILLYNQKHNGFTYIDEIHSVYSPLNLNFANESDNILLQYPNHDGTRPFSNVLVDLHGNTIFQWPNNMEFTLTGLVVYSIYENNRFYLRNKLFIKELQNDTLFYLSESNKLEPDIIFDTRDKRITPEVRSDGFYYDEHTYEYIMIQNIFGSERFLYFSYYYNKNYTFIIYDKQTKTKYKVPEKGFLKDDIIGGINIQPQYCYNGNFYSWIDVFKLKEYLSTKKYNKEKVKNPEKKEALLRLVNTLSENNNPILIVTKIK